MASDRHAAAFPPEVETVPYAFENRRLLKEIYARRDVTGLDASEFYWTIRIMHGPEMPNAIF